MRTTRRRQRVSVKKHRRTLSSGREITVRRHSRNILQKNRHIRLLAHNPEEIKDELWGERGSIPSIDDRMKELEKYGKAYIKDHENPDAKDDWGTAVGTLIDIYPDEETTDRDRIDTYVSSVNEKLDALEAPAREAKVKAAKEKVEAAKAATVQPIKSMKWGKKKSELKKKMGEATTKQDALAIRVDLEQYKSDETRHPKLSGKDLRQYKQEYDKLIILEETLPATAIQESIVEAPETGIASMGRGERGPLKPTEPYRPGKTPAPSVGTKTITDKTTGETYIVKDTQKVLRRPVTHEDIKYFESIGIIKPKKTAFEKIKELEKLGVI